MNDKLTSILAELRSRFEALYGERLVQMLLFGSQARGDAEPGSDIDVLVVLKDPAHAGEEIDRTIDLAADLSLQHDEVISCVFMSEDRFKRRHGPLLRNIRREGIRIWLKTSKSCLKKLEVALPRRNGCWRGLSRLRSFPSVLCLCHVLRCAGFSRRRGGWLFPNIRR